MVLVVATLILSAASIIFLHSFVGGSITLAFLVIVALLCLFLALEKHDWSYMLYPVAMAVTFVIGLAQGAGQ